MTKIKLTKELRMHGKDGAITMPAGTWVEYKKFTTPTSILHEATVRGTNGIYLAIVEVTK